MERILGEDCWIGACTYLKKNPTKRHAAPKYDKETGWDYFVYRQKDGTFLAVTYHEGNPFRARKYK
jgi:hypothetical protein